MDLSAELIVTLEDHFLSRSERKSLVKIIDHELSSGSSADHIRAMVFRIASEKITTENQQFVLEWTRDVINLLQAKSVSSSEAFFSPGEACRSAIIKTIDEAESQLRICVFTISDDLITKAIVKAFKRNVDVRIITDNDKSFDHGSDIDLLAKAGLKVRMDMSSNHMHHKFMVADTRYVITGSYNWTSSAARFNHENIILSTEAGLISAFLNEFDRLWNSTKDY